jgi:hypothetical protein
VLCPSVNHFADERLIRAGDRDEILNKVRMMIVVLKLCGGTRNRDTPVPQRRHRIRGCLR